MNLADRAGLLRSRIVYDWNPLKASRMRRFYRDFVSPGDLFFDIGAHVGDRTALWRSLGARVVSVEPQAQCVRILERRFRLDPGVTVLGCAAGDREGVSRLRLSPGNPTLATLSPEWIETVSRVPSFDGISWAKGDAVPVTTLDLLIGRFGTPSFVKIDVEGYEARVLKGLSEPVGSLSFEYLPASVSVALECLDLLSSIGDYEFNVSVGERFAMEYPDWVDSGEIRKRLSALPAGGKSGDVYARIGSGA